MVWSGRVRPLTLPARSSILNAYAERWVKSVQDECLSTLIFVGEASLRRALRQSLAHYHEDRNHQGKGTVLLVPEPLETNHTKPIRCRERLGGLFHYDYRAAAYRVDEFFDHTSSPIDPLNSVMELQWLLLFLTASL